MQKFMLDTLAIIIGTVIGMLIFDRIREKHERERFSEYVPSIEGFGRMDIQSPDEIKFSRGTLETV